MGLLQLQLSLSTTDDDHAVAATGLPAIPQDPERRLPYWHLLTLGRLYLQGMSSVIRRFLDHPAYSPDLKVASARFRLPPENEVSACPEMRIGGIGMDVTVRTRNAAEAWMVTGWHLDHAGA